MRLLYATIYILMIIALVTCAVFARRSEKPARASVGLLEAALIVPIVGNLIVIVSGDRTMAFIGSYIYLLGMDLLMFALVNFTNTYCRGIGNGTQKPTVMYVALAADAVQILLNPIFGHAFDIEAVTAEGELFYRQVPYLGQTLHRIVDYVVFLCVILIFVLASVLTPKIYRERFTVILTALVIIGCMQAYYIFSGTPVDRTVVAYGIFGMLIFYFAILYRPLRLLDQMLSNIVSDLSDAFYIFDHKHNCIWANDQGCRLVGVSDKNYDVITNKLTEMFGEPEQPMEKSAKLSVGSGDDLRFYQLEESEVKDVAGRLNGYYLRVQDVTEGEQELLVKDQQIGQISKEAYRDVLTGVGNKAAYVRKVAELNAAIEEGLTDLAIVMVDINNLKQINDEHGHKAGDLYIRGCCRFICDTFKHSPVYRIGGDEFVALLTGEDFAERAEKVETLRKSYAAAFADASVEPWLRYSAAVGMAERTADDRTAEPVFKRADAAMYAEKNAFKQAHGSYR